MEALQCLSVCDNETLPLIHRETHSLIMDKHWLAVVAIFLLIAWQSVRWIHIELKRPELSNFIAISWYDIVYCPAINFAFKNVQLKNNNMLVPSGCNNNIFIYLTLKLYNILLMVIIILSYWMGFPFFFSLADHMPSWCYSIKVKLESIWLVLAGHWPCQHCISESFE